MIARQAARRGTSGLITLLAVLSTWGPVHAQPSDPGAALPAPTTGQAPTVAEAQEAPSAGSEVNSQHDEIARLHFKTGTAHFDAGEYERAAEEFRQAYALSPRAELLYNLSQAYERLAQLGPAIEAMEGYLEQSDRITAEDRSRLEVRLANMRKRQAQQAEAVAPQNVAAAGAQPAPASSTQAAEESEGSIFAEPWLWVAVGVAAGVALGVVLLPGGDTVQPEPLRTDNALPNIELRAGGMR